jgi:maltose/moltooligosaccharide transporter
MLKYRRGPIWILAGGQLAVLLLWTTYDFFVPIFLQAGRPDFDAGEEVRGFALDPRVTGFVMTLDNMAGLLILPYIGALSDRTRTRWGRRMPYLLIGVPIAALAFALIPYTLARPLPLFMGAIVLTLLAMDVIRTPLTALLPDLTPPRFRSPANGIITALQGLGAILAFFAGSWLFRSSPAAPFLLASAVLLGATLLVVTLIREPEQPEEAEEAPPVIASLRTIWQDRDRSALVLLASIVCAWLAVSGNKVFFSRYVISALHLEAEVAGQLMGVYAASLALGAFPAGLLGARLGRARAMQVGFLIYGAATLANTVISTIPPLVVTQVIAGFCLSLILVNALPLVLDHAPAFRDGAYSGLYYLATQSAEIGGPILAGSVLHQAGNTRALFVYTPVAMLLAFVFALRVRPAATLRRQGSASRAPTAPLEGSRSGRG